MHAPEQQKTATPQTLRLVVVLPDSIAIPVYNIDKKRKSY
jgi:hypothetical protein